jgi:hypothetical protein
MKRYYLKSGQDSFLPNPFQFIIHLPSLHLTLHRLNYRKKPSIIKLYTTTLTVSVRIYSMNICFNKMGYYNNEQDWRSAHTTSHKEVWLACLYSCRQVIFSEAVCNMSLVGLVCTAMRLVSLSVVYLAILFQWPGIYSVEWRGDTWMINLEWCDRR